LAASALAFTLFAGPFVPVLGPLSTLAFAAGYVWVGAALWTGATGRVGTAQSGRRRLHLPDTSCLTAPPAHGPLRVPALRAAVARHPVAAFLVLVDGITTRAGPRAGGHRAAVSRP
jgi:hypothetical protein